MAVQYLHSSEVDDFRVAVKNRGRSPDDFELADSPQSLALPMPDTISNVVGVIRVKSRTNGEERTYSTGSSITHAPVGQDYVQWVTDFLVDLDAGAFGKAKPPAM